MKTSFDIIILHDRNRYKFHIDLLKVTKTEEIYQLTAKNRTLILKNNRPILKAKHLKHWQMTWKVEGQIWNVHFQELICKAIEKEI